MFLLQIQVCNVIHLRAG